MSVAQMGKDFAVLDLVIVLYQAHLATVALTKENAKMKRVLLLDQPFAAQKTDCVQMAPVSKMTPSSVVVTKHSAVMVVASQL